jgi:hypothetical protein
MRDDDVGLGIDDILDVVTHQPAVPGAGGHGAGVRIGQGSLTIRRVGQGFVHRLQPRDLLPDAAVAAGKVGDLPGPCLALLLTVDADHLIDVAFDIASRWVRRLAILFLVKLRSFGPLTRTSGVRGLTVHRLELGSPSMAT